MTAKGVKSNPFDDLHFFSPACQYIKHLQCLHCKLIADSASVIFTTLPWQRQRPHTSLTYRRAWTATLRRARDCHLQLSVSSTWLHCQQEAGYVLYSECRTFLPRDAYAQQTVTIIQRQIIRKWYTVELYFNGRPIDSRIWSIERRHFQWPWTTPTPGFKVTPFFDAEYLRNGTR